MELGQFANHPLRHAFEEAAAADRAYRQMVKIAMGPFQEYEKAWKEFLHRIERVWSKTQAAVCAMPGWKKIESEVAALRKSDPLLRYLVQARNVEEHSIQELASEWDPQLKGQPIGNKMHLSWQPWDRPLLPVVNRGVRYDPPRIHLGQPIGPLLKQGKAEPRVIAELAMQFYVAFLNRVSTEVVGEYR
jgi:hypothetical protein